MVSGDVLVPSDKPRVAGYVLAGGASARFGRDKALVELGGKAMLARTCKLLATAAGAEPAIVGDPAKYGRCAAVCIPDGWPGEGPLGGIVTALLHAQGLHLKRDWNLMLSCDMPFLTREWLAFLCDRARRSEAQVVLAQSAKGPEPLCACWRTDAAEALQRGFERGIRKVTDGIALLSSEMLDESEWKRFDNSGRLFWNMNTSEDHEIARRILETEQQ